MDPFLAPDEDIQENTQIGQGCLDAGEGRPTKYSALVVAALSLLVPMVFRAGEIWATLHDVRNRANMHEGRLELVEQGLHDVELKLMTSGTLEFPPSRPPTQPEEGHATREGPFSEGFDKEENS